METYWGLGHEIDISLRIFLAVVLLGVNWRLLKSANAVQSQFGKQLVSGSILLAVLLLALPMTIQVFVLLVALVVAGTLVAASRTPAATPGRMEQFGILYGLLFLVLAFGFARNQERVVVSSLRTSASSGVTGQRSIEGSPLVEMTIQRGSLLNPPRVEKYRVQSSPDGPSLEFTDRDWFLGPQGFITGHDLADRIAAVNGVSIVSR